MLWILIFPYNSFMSNLIDNLTRLRHNINYYGYKPNVVEVNDVLSIAETTFQPLLFTIKKKLE